jgi:hypothetical protein
MASVAFYKGPIRKALLCERCKGRIQANVAEDGQVYPLDGMVHDGMLMCWSCIREYDENLPVKRKGME